MVVEYNFREYKLAKLLSKINQVPKNEPKNCHLVTLSLRPPIKFTLIFYTLK